ncbi:Predicted protein [Jatrophihabitans endophyticus]|uniref:Phosphodiester glycosidase domain-containing protein n=1 Tax=Jatrophihabitans endophyticus TaxID=1206085 RepID=A0A1M5MBZ6_9ACTN|nr:phosphodiester glycosidase family protein [Jatrophihabitans endophyticus]SHG74830.1 Predicted protein [Jatrophihabitans endophyticus]
MRRSVLAAAAAALCLPAVGLDAAPAASAASSSTVRLAPGVTLTHSVFRLKSGGHSYPERVWTLRARLSAHLQLDAASPRNVIGAARQTTLTLGRQERAVAGINGDTFYFPDAAAVPRAGITHGGRVLKSALVGKNAVLYATSSGRVAIGDPGFRGRISTTDRTGKARSFGITSRNSIENAANGGMAFVDRAVLTSSLRKAPQRRTSCAVVRLAERGGDSYRVTSIAAKATKYTRAAAGTHALVSCASSTAGWIRSALRTGQDLTLTAGYRVRGITTLLSGVRQLIRGGKRFTDRTGLNVYGNSMKPETFGCVLRDARTVLLGVVEGDRSGRAGMTYAQLTTYLLARKCRSALVFDGSGSSTLVAQRPAKHLAVQNLTTASDPTDKGKRLRKVVNGLFLVRR